MTKKIGVFYNLLPGGAKRAIFDMVKGLSARGYELVEIVPSSSDSDWCSLGPYVRDRKVFPFTWPLWRKRIPFLTPYLSLLTSLNGLYRYSRVSREIADWMASQSFDCLFANDCMYSMNPLLTGYVSTWRINYIHHGSYLASGAVDHRVAIERKLSESIKSTIFKPAYFLWDYTHHAVEKWSASKSDVLLCNSQLAKKKIFQAYGRPSQVVHYGVDTDLFKPTNENGFGDYVLSAGAVNPHKSFDFLINSLARIPSSQRPELKIAANHIQEAEAIYLADLAERANVDLDIVRPQSDLELVELYARAKAFVFASRFEPFGLVALEAMACGTPVVGVDDGGYVDCIVDGETGLITGRSPVEFGRALAMLLENRELRDRMGIASREFVLNYWTWDRCVDELEIFLNSNPCR